MCSLNIIEQALATDANRVVTAETAPATTRFRAAPRAARRNMPMAAPTGNAPGNTQKRTPKPFVLPDGYEAFSPGSLGNFPYYWQDPSSLKFNALTYRWVSSGLAPSSLPVQLNGVFTNRYMQAISKIAFVLSKADQAILDNDQARTTNQQLALMVAWKSAFGSLPADAMRSPPINLIMEEITTRWASPPTDLYAIVRAADPSLLLNTVPDAGKPVLPYLMKYLAVISASLPLLDAIVRNNALLKAVMAALQAPALSNGALETNRNRLQPAFDMQTPVADILKGLAATNTNRAVTLNLSLIPQSNGALEVTVNQGKSARIAPDQILSLQKPHSADPLSAALSQSGSASTLTARFTGATPVFFAPAPFSTQTLRNWFWADPIIDACRNANADKTGFRFALQHNRDFSEKGDFGYLSSVVISRVPSITVKTTVEHAAQLRTAINANAGKSLNFLGRDIGTLNTPGGFKAEIEGTFGDALKLEPAAAQGAGGSIDARAFVLGAQTVFPIAAALSA